MSATLANIKLKPVTVSWNGNDLGYCDGDIELAVEETFTNVNAHQEGTNVLDQIRTGNSAELTLTLKETSLAQLKVMFGAAGNLLTPSGGTEVLGWGSYKNFTGILASCQKLVLHPLDASSASDYTNDFAAWKAYPMLDKLNWSGENLQMIPVTFKILPDLTKNSKVRLFTFGDHTQTLT